MPLPPLSNQLHRARQILEALQQGIDPIDKCELPKTSIVNNIEVNRAIGMAVMAVDHRNNRMQRRSQLPSNVGRSWSMDGQNSIIEAFQSGEPVKSIAARQGRTVRAIEARLQGLGLLEEADRTTEDRYDSTAKKGAAEVNSFILRAVGTLARNPEAVPSENVTVTRFCLIGHDHTDNDERWMPREIVTSIWFLAFDDMRTQAS